MSAPATTTSVPPSLAQSARDHYRPLKAGVLAMLVMMCAVPFSLNLVDPDLWGHVRYAQDWLAAGELPRTATHTYTAAEHPWVNHENIAELSFALGYELLGIYGLLVLKCLLGLAIMVAMWRTAARHGVGALATWTLLVLVAANLQAFFPLRPQLFSFALCSLALVCLDRAFAAWNDDSVNSEPTGSPAINFRWLWPLPVIFVVWVNAHGGFVAGLAIVGAYLLGRMIELAFRLRKKSNIELADFGALLRLAAIGLACLAATVVNPYGLGMHQWLWHSWAGAPPEITEWAPPLPGKPVFWPFVTLVVVAVASLAATRRRRDWTQIVVLALVVWQACEHLRHIAFVALLCGFWLPVHWQSAIARLRPNPDRRLPIVDPPRWFRLGMATAILAAIALQSVSLARRLTDFPVLRSQYPVDAIQFMADRGLGGKAVVAFNWAQYAIAALAPDVLVQFDGRFDTCYPQEVIDMHFDFLLGDITGPRDRSAASGPLDGQRVLSHGQPDLVLIERRYANPTAIMQSVAAAQRPEWTLLYRDSFAELWGRRSRYDDPASPHYLPLAARRLGVVSADDHVQWPALPRRDLLSAQASPALPTPHSSELAAASQSNP